MNAFITYDRLRSRTNVHEVSSTQPSVLYHSLKTFIDTFTDAKRFEFAHLLSVAFGFMQVGFYIVVLGNCKFGLS